MDKNVVGFDISMKKSGIIKNLVSFAELGHDLPNFVLGHEGHLRNEVF